MNNTLNHQESETIFNETKQFIPGGVNSPVRAFKSVNMNPVIIDWACGSKMYDVDGNEYVDYVSSWGPLILGHSRKEVVEAIYAAAKNGTSYGAPTKHELNLAKIVCDLVPSVEMVRFVNSGTEAVMAAIRLAKAYTKKTKIIKFKGCYHGAIDCLLVSAGSGIATLNLPDSEGISQSSVNDTIVINYNDFESISDVFKQYDDQIAAVIIEPVVGNSGCIMPKKGYLQHIRDLCTSFGALLIFDEVMTGFRISLGGAQSYFNVLPDITTMGKIIGGGLPVGAYGGKENIMSLIAPSGPVYQAGTLSGNPLAMTAGITTLNLLKELNPYEELASKTDYLCKKIQELSLKYDIPVKVNYIESMFSIFFANQPVIDFDTAKTSNLQLFINYFKSMLSGGIYIAPSQFEANFVSTEHNSDDIDKTLEQIEQSFSKLKNLP